MSAPLVLDASVAAKCIGHEADSDLARAAVAGRSLLAPSLILVEVANVIRKRAAAGELSKAAAQQAFSDFLLIRMLRAEVDEALSSATLNLALALRHPTQDCLYLALAVQYDVRVLTADRKFAAAVRADAVLADRVALLGEPLV